jgi:DNA mismatch repair protein MutS
MANTSSSATPMLRQYYEIKKENPGALLFFRLGDFYEMFFDDALLGARELDIALTARHKESGNPVPMCGVPHHAAGQYVAKLIQKGYRVAICEQVEEPSAKTKLVRRRVVRVITPGTAIDEQMLEGAENRYLAAIFGAAEGMGAAFLDLTTGEFLATEFAGDAAFEKVLGQLEQFQPREVITPRTLEKLLSPLFPRHALATSEASAPSSEPEADSERQTPPRFAGALTVRDDWAFAPDQGAEFLKARFGAATLAGYGLDGKKWATAAAAAALRYVCDTQMNDAGHVTGVSWFEPRDFMQLDSATLRNLEIIESASGGKRETLLGTLDATETGMGARLLRSWLVRPSMKIGEINARLDAVAELHRDAICRDKLRQTLKSVQDIERLLGRVSLGVATPRDLVALRASGDALPDIKTLLGASGASLLHVLRDSLDECADVRERIAATLTENPPMKIEDGGVIRAGVNAELDEARALRHNAQSVIAAIETRERERTGIGSLKVRFNNVFGYYIEISKANLKSAPSDYERKQTLVNAERFTTPELKEYEEKALNAEAAIFDLETRLFQELRAGVMRETPRLQAAARIVATLDALAAFAHLAALRRYVRPTLHEGDELEIAAGRHPVVETHTTRFVPNDVALNNSTERVQIITGPNMGGKSVFLRQTGLIAVMAHVGSFVPAKSARIPIIDRIFTRIGASDNLAHGRSTFMVEMTETANILNTATPRSLALLDEIGRGTSTFDGLSIAWAVGEYLHNHPQHAAKTLFATHYHELTELARLLPGAGNLQLAVSENQGDIVFLHKVVEGSASKSYGIEVARLAGLPAAVVTRAREILENLEANELDVLGKPKLARHLPGRGKKWKEQPTLFEKANESVIEELRMLDTDHITSEQALEALRRLQRRLV